MSAINDGEPAFPVVLSPGESWTGDPQNGMSLRDYFAAKALHGMLANQHHSD